MVEILAHNLVLGKKYIYIDKTKRSKEVMGNLVSKGNFEAGNYNRIESSRLVFNLNGTEIGRVFDYDAPFEEDISGGKRKSRRNRKNKKSRRKSLRKTNRRR